MVGRDLPELALWYRVWVTPDLSCSWYMDPAGVPALTHPGGLFHYLLRLSLSCCVPGP